MLLKGLKYIGNKESGELLVLTLNPTHPQRKQIFKRKEVKLLGRDINEEIANYLAAEYRGVVEFIDVEVDAKLIFKDRMQEICERFDGELPPEDSLIVFCEVFGVNLINDLQQRNAELEKALRELTELKANETSAKSKKPAKKKSDKMRRSTASKAK